MSAVIDTDWLRRGIDEVLPSLTGWWLFVHPDQESHALLAAATVPDDIRVRVRDHLAPRVAVLLPVGPPAMFLQQGYEFQPFGVE
ncbi:hypothetical protein [Deinococcus humi]|uniref:Uncharacterized protein n=1 Tax=Deinococcus humi TaxID=662880 RepID=A0A7W8JVI3_9DEIO|nr:hypothetical protein [Deinococcus humi]MBB5364010.1 hypothetical protein [Deinococcus humi]GGO32672.1 hypothetical protein GCM10008949_30580 [Deinococcus humi]